MTKLEKALFIIGTICILDGVLALALNCGANLGTYLPVIVGFILIAYTLFRKTGLYRNMGTRLRFVEKLLTGLFLVWVVSFIIVTAMLVTASISEEDKASDCILILGAGLHGEEPSLVLLERMNLALDNIKNNKNVKVIVSGGKGTGEDITEAEAMKRYLVRHGASEDDILLEEKATSTMENILFSAEVFEDRMGYKLDTVTIVTSDFHMFRTKLLARRLGLKAHGISAKTPFYIYPNVFSREYFALIKSVMFDR